MSTSLLANVGNLGIFTLFLPGASLRIEGTLLLVIHSGERLTLPYLISVATVQCSSFYVGYSVNRETPINSHERTCV